MSSNGKHIPEEELPIRTFKDNSAEARTEWALLRRFAIGIDGDLYLLRISILTTPWFSIKLHRIYRPDRQRDLHDHPWAFLSIILFGSYTEETPDGIRRCHWWNFKRAEDSHSIKTVSRTPVWTLVFCGPRRRVWGFHTKNGWVPWQEYEKLMEA